mmetsp:Transcript_79606/g.257437  ORF Transcript_79606/g.257437 Transcript_79606/m.257437 type:complete len:464 (+) Transcript_79606:51-1442(+)
MHTQTLFDRILRTTSSNSCAKHQCDAPAKHLRCRAPLATAHVATRLRVRAQRPHKRGHFAAPRLLEVARATAALGETITSFVRSRSRSRRHVHPVQGVGVNVRPDLVRAARPRRQELQVHRLDVLHQLVRGAVGVLHGQQPDQVLEGPALGHGVEVHESGVLDSTTLNVWRPHAKGDNGRNGALSRHVELCVLDHVKALHRLDECVDGLGTPRHRALIHAAHVVRRADAALCHAQGPGVCQSHRVVGRAHGLLHLLIALRATARNEGLDGVLIGLPDHQQHLHIVGCVRGHDDGHVAKAHRLAPVRDGTLPQDVPRVRDVGVDLSACLVQDLAVLLVNPHIQVVVHYLLRVQKTHQDLIGLVRGVDLHGIKVATVQDRAIDGLERGVLSVVVDLDDEHLPHGHGIHLRERDEVLATIADPFARNFHEERPSLLHAVHRRVVGDERIVVGVRRWQRSRNGQWLR